MTNRANMPSGYDAAMTIQPAPAPPASIEEAIQMLSDEEVVEILCEIVGSLPDEYPGKDHPVSSAARVQRDNAFRLWAEYLQGGPVREILRELL